MTESALKTLKKATLRAAKMTAYIVIVEIGAITLTTYEWSFILLHFVPLLFTLASMLLWIFT